MRTMSSRYDEPQYDTREEADAALEEAREEHEEYVASLLEADVDVADTSVVAPAAVRAARKVIRAQDAVSSLTTARENGHGREILHRRLRKLRRGVRMWDESYVDWVVFDMEDVREYRRERPDLSLAECALRMAREAGMDTQGKRSRALGDTFREPAVPDLRGSRALVTARGGLDV